MRKTFIRTWGAVAAAACLFVVAPVWSVQKIKITVARTDAAIHLSPDAGSRVIQGAPVDSVYEAERKTGEWYEIKLPSKLGVTIIGYIHEKFVTTEPVPLKEPEAQVQTVRETAAAAPPAKRLPARADVAVRIGFTPMSLIPGQSDYSHTWSSNLLKAVAEMGEIGHDFGGSPGAGLAFSYFLSGGFGLQLRYDHQFTAKVGAGDSSSAYAIAWSWDDGRDPFSLGEEWGVSGEYAVSPVSLNIIYKIPSGGKITPVFGAGMTYFMGSVKAETTRGYGFSWESSPTQYVDYLDIPLRISESLGGLGWNVGAGLDVALLPKIALNVEAVYFGGKTIEKPWRPIPGTYAGNIFPSNAWQATQPYLDENANQVEPLRIKTSFVRIFAGVKFLF